MKGIIHCKIEVEGKTFLIPLTALYDNSKEVWKIKYKEFHILTVPIDKLIFIDILLKYLSDFCQKFFNSKVDIYKYLDTFKVANSPDERKQKKWERWQMNKKLPSWQFPDVYACSARPLDIMTAIQEYFSQPEIVKAITVTKTSKKFGL
jgi:hypothetical protein